ncbi:MAG: hypothetical protein ACI4CC_05850 [Lachnospiraceae bacterium]
MKKSNFVALILGTISCVFFGLGMCMAMIEEWNAFKPGIVVGCIGLLLALITVLFYRKMENKAPVRFSGKAVLTVLVGVIGALALGVGMCFCMVWNNLILGVVLGLLGILVLLGLIPLCKGIK